MEKYVGNSLKNMTEEELENIYGSDKDIEPYSWSLLLTITSAGISGLLSLKSYNEDCI